MYGYTGLGADLAEGDVSKPGMGYEAAYGSKFSKTTAIAEASEVAFDPNSVGDSNVQSKEQEFADLQNEIGRARHGGGNGNGSGGASPGSEGPGGSDEMGSF